MEGHLIVIPGPSAARNPESITTVFEGVHCGARSGSAANIDSGFALRAPRNDDHSVSIFTSLVILRQTSIWPASQALASASDVLGTVLKVCFLNASMTAGSF